MNLSEEKLVNVKSIDNFLRLTQQTLNIALVYWRR